MVLRCIVGTEVGSVLTAVTANDVDTNPALTYSLEQDGGVFSVDRFSGRITLVRGLDFERRREYRLRVAASDTAHSAATTLTVSVSDVNDNAPVFAQPHYETTLPGKNKLLLRPSTDVVTIKLQSFVIHECQSRLQTNSSKKSTLILILKHVSTTNSGS